MSFKKISPYEIDDNVFTALDKDWMLICAPDSTKECGANAMTASWGGFGILWYRPVATLYVRPQRYTYNLTEENDRFSLCFFSEEYRDALKVCGTKSGRDMDKISSSGLSVCFDGGAPVIEQSDVVLVCKKAYSDFIKEECFDDESHLSSYPAKDYHKMYILEIKKILVKQ